MSPAGQAYCAIAALDVPAARTAAIAKTFNLAGIAISTRGTGAKHLDGKLVPTDPASKIRFIGVAFANRRHVLHNLRFLQRGELAVEQPHNEIVLPSTFDEGSLALATLLDKAAFAVARNRARVRGQHAHNRAGSSMPIANAARWSWPSTLWKRTWPIKPPTSITQA
jgi:hypothetical protein